MRTLINGLVIGLFVLGSGHLVYAGCGDEAAVIAARATADATCTAMGAGCSNASNHGAYVSCVAGVAKMLSSGTNPTLPKNCKGAVKKCAAHSTCGKPGEVTCCFTGKSGPKCKNAKSAGDCSGKGGTPTLDPMNTSCCSNTHPLTENACMASPSGAFLN
jgi:hypothetical protein